MEETTQKAHERAIIVGLGRQYLEPDDTPFVNPFEELTLLARTAGARVVDRLVQAGDTVSPMYYIGKGKAQELKKLVETRHADIVLFDNPLSPAQLSNLEKLMNVKVVDRPGLILDIFSQRARTREAKTQVELAQLQYLLPRLTRQWTHLSRQQGGIGVRGPGETQLEVDRRRIRQRIGKLKDTLEKIDRQRTVGRKGRSSTFRAALVGYTNAGKSTLLNQLSGAGVPVENLLFKTLDSVTRMVKFNGVPEMLLSDTVGFIRNLPHDLVASFKSTLDEVRDADVLVHVVDITHPEWERQITTVREVLGELGAADKETVLLFNKIDALCDTRVREGLSLRYPDALFAAGRTGEGCDLVKDRLVSSMLRGWEDVTWTFSPGDHELLNEVYRHGTIHSTEGRGDTIILHFSIPRPVAERLRLAGEHIRNRP